MIRATCVDCGLGYPADPKRRDENVSVDMDSLIVITLLMTTEKQPVPHCRCGGNTFRIEETER